MKSKSAILKFVMIPVLAAVPWAMAQSQRGSFGCLGIGQCQGQQQGQGQGQGQRQTANGGNATGGNATGGNATGGNAAGGTANATTGSSTSNATTGNSTSSSANTSSNSSTNAATNGPQSNNQVTNYNDVRQTPATFVPPQFSTAACQQAGGAGGAGGLFSFGVSGSKTNGECEKRATAQDFAAIGNSEAAAKILCGTKAAKKAGLTMEDCLKIQQKPGTAAPEQGGNPGSN